MKKENIGRNNSGELLSIKWSVIAVLTIFVLIAATAPAGAQSLPPASFMINGWVFNSTGQPLYGPDVNITNLNTNENYTVKTNASYNYYRVITNSGSWNVSAGEVLNFTVNDSGNITGFNYPVEQDDINNGGLFGKNISFAAPDLKISEVWVCWPHGCTICYNVTNIGSANATAGHNTTLYVDTVVKANDTVPVELGSGASYKGCFDTYPWVYTPTEDNITVCADSKDSIDESGEGNNCLMDTWMCGDCNLGQKGDVNILDVFAIYDNITAMHKPVRSEWAADCNLVGQKGTIDILDVFAVYDNITAMHKPIKCCCQA